MAPFLTGKFVTLWLGLAQLHCSATLQDCRCRAHSGIEDQSCRRVVVSKLNLAVSRSVALRQPHEPDHLSSSHSFQGGLQVGIRLSNLYLAA